ncbi:hypothetical protein [Saccharothrix luteola]|uniref:hypothetical protein n=1 Tax=Saccharothrix luteola TaxID=2893018 RepID=UPI001E572494|nr:hypothetical protein [Saccharothrix luteola]MCC8242805.1 hypothetical protein [Saccharothrix luteola]
MQTLDAGVLIWPFVRRRRLDMSGQFAAIGWVAGDSSESLGELDAQAGAGASR